MRSLINDPVLVLNKGWVPIHIKPMKDAIADVFSGNAEIIDHLDESLTMYSWEDWFCLPIPDASVNADGTVSEPKVIHGVKIDVRAPEIIVLNDYNDVLHLEVQFNKKNLCLRDNFICQYCSKKLSFSSATMDHVVPRSKRGPHTWENVVLSCFNCNIKKRDRTPKEANMFPLKKPVQPKWYPVSVRYSLNAPKSWSRFFPDKERLPAMARS